MMRCQRVWPLAFLMVVIPSLAHANAGTPLMWAAAIHLVVGNALLGVFEGLLLGFLFRTSIWKAVLLMIAANYASAWLGFMLRGLVDTENARMTIETVQLLPWGILFAAFMLTLLVELPFILVALRKKERFVRKALFACLLIQSLSYTVLVGWYARSSYAGIVTELEIVSPSEMGVPDGYSLYYIDTDGERILRCELAGEHKETVGKIESEDPDDRLAAKPENAGAYDLYLLLPDEERLVLKDFAEAASVDWYVQEGRSRKPYPTSFNFGVVPRVAVESDWEYQVGYWPGQGISGRCESQQLSFQYSLETPFAAWNVRNAAHISGDFAVFQLGRDQICILQPQKKRIALIARGKGPVVAQDKASAE